MGREGDKKSAKRLISSISLSHLLPISHSSEKRRERPLNHPLDYLYNAVLSTVRRVH